MRRQLVCVCATVLLLITCASCRTEDLDSNGDGVITKSEILSAAFNLVCGDQAEPEAPAEGATDDETAAVGPIDETPADEEATDQVDNSASEF
jgi:hypothetical protein